jgi:hypothetical protein
MVICPVGQLYVLEKLEQLAESYGKLKDAGESSHAELAKLAASIVDSISSPSFSFPIAEEALSVSGTTSYTYKENATYPALFEFLGELLHLTVPLEVQGAKFGPGEILVSKDDKAEADAELASSTKELQKLVHARRAEIITKHAGATPP